MQKSGSRQEERDNNAEDALGSVFVREQVYCGDEADAAAAVHADCKNRFEEAGDADRKEDNEEGKRTTVGWKRFVDWKGVKIDGQWNKDE